MPGITNPAEEYFKDGLWGWVTDQWKKLLADASGFLQINVAAQDIDVEVTQTAAADLVVGSHYWTGSAWAKRLVGWSVPSRYALTATGTAEGTGHATATITLDIAGYVFMMQGFTYVHDAGVDKKCDGWISKAGVDMWVFDVAVVVSAIHMPVFTDLLLAHTDSINARAVAPGAGKTCVLCVWGYLMPTA